MRKRKYISIRMCITSSKKRTPKEQHQKRTEKLSGKRNIMKGVRQGDTLSPVMFTAAVEEIVKRMNIEAGINIHGVRLSNLRFVDDIILFAEGEEKLKTYAGRSEQRKV